MSDPLEGPKLKIKRATVHALEFDRLTQEYFASDPHSLVTEMDADGVHEVLKLRINKEPPTMMAIVLGDVVHNLRSALDQVIYAAASAKGIKLKSTGFPIEATAKKFEAAIEQRKIEQRLPLVAQFLREIKPYKGGNNGLWGLHALNVMDKHKLIVPAAAAMVHMEAKIELRPVAGRHVIPAPSWKPLDKEVIISRIAGKHVHSQIKCAFTVTFGKFELFGDEPIIEVFSQIGGMTEKIVMEAESRFFS